MYSGKSSTMIRHIDRALAISQRALILSPLLDTRSTSEIVCHTGQRRATVKIKKLVPFLSDPCFETLNLIGIDEAQFFQEQDLFDFASAAVKRNKTVVVAGLDTNFRQEAFGGVVRLCTIADEVIKLTALCSVCGDGSPAIFTRRLISCQHEILVGGAESYQAVCRRHV